MKMKRSRKMQKRQLTQLQHSIEDTPDEQKQKQKQKINAACKKITVLVEESDLRKQITSRNLYKKHNKNRNYQPKKTLCTTISTKIPLSTSVDIFDHRQKISRKNMSICRRNRWLNGIFIVLQIIQQCTLCFGTDVVATTPMQSNWTYTTISPMHATKVNNNASWQNDSIFMRLAKRFSTGNELWDGIIRDCYGRPNFSCFQKNVYNYLNDAFSAEDVNVTQRLKFFKNDVDYDRFIEPTESALSKKLMNEDDEDVSLDSRNEPNDAHLVYNKISAEGRECK